MEQQILTNFDISKYLDNDEIIAEYLSQIFEDGDTNELLEAIGEVAKAKGMTKIANDTGLGRASLYKSFKPNAKPKFDTIMKVMDSIGVKMKISA